MDDENDEITSFIIVIEIDREFSEEKADEVFALIASNLDDLMKQLSSKYNTTADWREKLLIWGE